MSLNINVYTENLSDELIPKIVKRLNEFEMEVEVHPEFSFETQEGFLPIKFRLKNPHLEILKNKKLISGFEIYIDNYDFNAEKESLKPKLTFLEKIFRKKQNEIEIEKPEIEKRLEKCKKSVNFIWHTGDSFELRFASLTSSILTELTNGVCTYPADDIWYENKNIVEEAYKEIKEYELTIKERDLLFHEFEGW
jgi:hypothetical protein